ncbi:RT0821/Lpp0805 family surface protein [Methylobacterium currus]|uniref:RT0821/Lpp0805 family surface protein n=1 Tax=Methylobacterium currus TaxID=2051553 RepID=UPI0039C08B36
MTLGLVVAASALGSVLASGGCSQPLIMFTPQVDVAPPEPESTGSIEPAAPKNFGSDLSGEDWRRAKAALSVALDPQGNGQPVKWDNPDSGMRGMVNPTGLPFVKNDEICRGFLASVIGPSGNRFVRGTGCRPSGGAWELKSLKTTTKPG